MGLILTQDMFGEGVRCGPPAPLPSKRLCLLIWYFGAQARVRVSRKQRGNLAAQASEALQGLAQLRLEKAKLVLGLQASHHHAARVPCCAGMLAAPVHRASHNVSWSFPEPAL